MWTLIFTVLCFAQSPHEKLLELFKPQLEASLNEAKNQLEVARRMTYEGIRRTTLVTQKDQVEAWKKRSLSLTREAQQALEWTRQVDPLIASLKRHWNEKEASELVTFFESPAGLAYLKKAEAQKQEAQKLIEKSLGYQVQRLVSELRVLQREVLPEAASPAKAKKKKP